MPSRAESFASSRIARGSAATGPPSGVGRSTPVMAAKLAREGAVSEPAGAAEWIEALPLSMMARMIRLLSSYGYAAAAAVPYAPAGDKVPAISGCAARLTAGLPWRSRYFHWLLVWSHLAS